MRVLNRLWLFFRRLAAPKILTTDIGHCLIAPVMAHLPLTNDLAQVPHPRFGVAYVQQGVAKKMVERETTTLTAVSYTHLTLPTSDLV